MHADAHYAIGASHLVCQDYALAGAVEAGAYAIVADGCTASPHSDIGARLLARSAERMLSANPENPVAIDIVAAAQAALATLDLDARSLDCTLMWAVASAGEIRIVVSGDGAVVAMRDDGSLESWSIEYERGAPAYLSYLLRDDRMIDLLAMDQTRRIEHRTPTEVSVRSGSVAREPYLFELRLELARYRLLALLSDGARSFTNARGEPIELGRVAAELLDFKSFAGRFVARRMRRFLGKQCAERGWSPKDDVAVAAVFCAGAP